jgi:hypothetical protein
MTAQSASYKNASSTGMRFLFCFHGIRANSSERRKTGFSFAFSWVYTTFAHAKDAATQEITVNDYARN